MFFFFVWMINRIFPFSLKFNNFIRICFNVDYSMLIFPGLWCSSWSVNSNFLLNIHFQYLVSSIALDFFFGNLFVCWIFFVFCTYHFFFKSLSLFLTLFSSFPFSFYFMILSMVSIHFFIPLFSYFSWNIFPSVSCFFKLSNDFTYTIVPKHLLAS